jgi:hypothetical protein
MKRNTLIEHKKAVMVCEENGCVSVSYNVLLTTQEANGVVKLVVFIITTKSTLICTNYGKIGHSMETYHNRKRDILIVLIAIVKSIKPIGGTKTQPIKSRKVPIHYPCIICFSVEHKSEKCPKKFEVQNMFRTKLIISHVMIAPKPPKTDNVPINVVAAITTRSQQSEQ